MCLEMGEEVDILIKGVDILTLDDGLVIERVDVAIVDGVIKRIGRNIRFDAREEIDGSKKIALPGLVDAHTHCFQILLRGALSLKELNVHPIWLKILIPFEAEMTVEEARASAELACLNMIKKGITAFAEAGGPYPEILAEVAHSSGLRARIAGSTMDRGPENYLRGVKESRELVRKWNSGRVIGWYSIRQIMTSSDELIQEVFKAAKEDRVGVHIHLNEEVSEIEHALSRWGKRPIEFMYEKGYLRRGVIAAHCAFLTDNEVKILADSSACVVHCPTINFTYMNFPKVPHLIERGAVVALGSDGGSYTGLDLFLEMREAVVSHTAYYGTPYHDFSILSPVSALRMATLNGARGIMEDRLGVVKEGYKADLILVDKQKPHLTPLHDLTTLPFFITGDDVSDVIVDGRVIMRERRVLTMDEEEVVKRAEEIAEHSLERIKKLVD